MPHRAPGSPHHAPNSYLTGKPIRYYRPTGSADVRRLIDEGFQAFNAARLSEACHIFSDRMLLPEHDTTIGLTVAGALTPAGLGGCMIELMDRGLVDFVISTGANLYHDLHYALNFTLHRGTPFLDDATCTTRASSASTTSCSRPTCCSKPTRTSATSSCVRTSAGLCPRPTCTTASASI